MTEIHIERRPPIWPWIVGVLALAVVAWILIAAVTDREPEGDAVVAQRTVDSPPGPPAGTSGRVPAAVQEYVRFAEEADGLEPGREHEYTAEGIRRLSAALSAHVQENANDTATRERFERFRQTADRLQMNPQSGEHAGMTRDVFTSAVDVFESARIEAGDLSRLRDTAEAISPDRPLLEQVDRVRQFFRQSAGALQSAAQNS